MTDVPRNDRAFARSIAHATTRSAATHSENYRDSRVWRAACGSQFAADWRAISSLLCTYTLSRWRSGYDRKRIVVTGGVGYNRVISRTGTELRSVADRPS